MYIRKEHLLLLLQQKFSYKLFCLSHPILARGLSLAALGLIYSYRGLICDAIKKQHVMILYHVIDNSVISKDDYKIFNC